MGISSKRDNESTVGQFGSGAKLAPVAAIRKGYEWVCLGSDDRGDYRLDYFTKEVDGYDIVYYRYTTEEGVTDIPSSFSLDAGVLSWDTDFQIYREAFANALDANLEFGSDYTVEIVDDIERKDGYFDVYLTADNDLLEYYENSDLYFKYGVSPDFESKYSYGVPESTSIGIFRNYRQRDFGKFEHVADARLFGKGGIWIGDLENPESIFSYQFDNFQLNEERRLANAYQVDNVIGYALRNLTDYDAIRELFAIDMLGGYEDSVEFLLPSYHLNGKSSPEWAEVWIEDYGYNCIPICPSGVEGHSSEEIVIQLQMRGYTYKVIKNLTMYKLLIMSPSDHSLQIADILGDRAEFDIVDKLEPSRQHILDKALRVVGHYESVSDDIHFVAFSPREHQATIHGVWVHDSRAVMLSVEALDIGVEHTVATIVHELDHANTGYSDDDRRFRDVADRRIGRLLMRLAEVDGI
jgi:hypothetical protein